MMDYDFLTDARDMYETIVANKSGHVYVSVYPLPKTKENCIYAGEGEAWEIWGFVEKAIKTNVRFSKRFVIRVATVVKEDTKNVKNAFAQNITVEYNPTGALGQQSQMAGIGSLPGAGMYGYPGADIGKIIDEKIAAVNKEWEHKDELRKRDEEIAVLKYENKQRKLKVDPLEQISDLLEKHEVDLNPLIQGIVRKFLSPRAAQPLPAVAGGARITRKGAMGEVPHTTEDDFETPENEGEMEDTNMTAMNEAVIKELLFVGEKDERILDIEYAKVIDATIRLEKFLVGLKQMGLADADLDAVSLLVETADFVINKPKKAQELVKQMKGENPTDNG